LKRLVQSSQQSLKLKAKFLNKKPPKGGFLIFINLITMSRNHLKNVYKMFDTIKISQEQTERLLELDEGHFLDLKSKRISPSKLTKTMAAFANAEGGELFVGIEDDPREWLGFEDIEKANAHIQIFDQLFPMG